ncbi:unannotated protein [freshwater metagenome]|uniref:Unannotated protein n=1 Tax=freshwater metagenome TaxID=449393 RepID=A0A6J5ZZ69_9ZZZZ
MLFTSDDEHCEDRNDRTVHRHRNTHLIQGNAVEQNLHVFNRIDSDACLADIAHNVGVVRVVPAVGGEIEGDRQAHLAGSEVASIKRVRLFGGRESGVLADRPRAIRVHRRSHATGVGGEARQCVDIAERLEIGSRVDRFYGDAFGGLPYEIGGIGALEVFGGRIGPGGGELF